MTAGRLAGVAALGAAWLLLVVGGALTRGPEGTPPGRAAYFRAWAALHGGYDPASGSTVVRLWLSLTHRVARPLAAAGVRPSFVTASGVLAAGTAAVPASAGHWAVLAAVVLVLSGLLDNLDGAVAVMTGRTSRAGAVLDSVTDRCADALGVVALGLAGAPLWTCLLALGATVLLEYTRARAGAVGLREVGVVTVGERPSRVIVSAVALLLAGIAPSHAELLAGGGNAVVGALGLVGFAQFSLTAARLLRENT